MRNLFKALLYTGLIVTANAGWPNLAQAQGISDLRDGDLRKLVVHSEAKPMPTVEFDGPDGKVSLADYAGKITVVNFWALWCAPCREEMPTLESLSQEYGGDDFAVVTVATGPNAPPAIDAFFDDIGVTTLPKYRDPRSGLARAAGVLGLPVTVILDRDGQELARLTGTADWHSDSARMIVEALIAKDTAG
ncbi:TlpA disulfide reductase family protein [Pseudooceanicola sp. MF1-13]|uniref:TlpA disulfide reductase family protein n=1 Tax=Pseudooceanicola sp. MF1-13 TaxID=3379095 RepID=UPI00389239FB